MKNFTVTMWENRMIDRVGYSCKGFSCPKLFSAEVEEETMEEIVEKVVSNIKNTRYYDKREYGFYESARIPYSNKAIDEESKLAGFILLHEIRYADGMSWQEGIYGLYVVDDKVIGGLLDLGKLLFREKTLKLPLQVCNGRDS